MYNNETNGKFLEKLTGEFIADIFPGAYMTIDTDEDKFHGTDGIVPWPDSKTGHIRFDVTFNLEGKDHYIFLGDQPFSQGNAPLNVKFAYRFGNSHSGGTLFQEPVLVIDITDCNQRNCESQFIKRDPDAIQSYKGQFKKIFDEGAKRFNEYILTRESPINILQVDKRYTEIILDAISRANKREVLILAEKLHTYKNNESKSITISAKSPHALAVGMDSAPAGLCPAFSFVQKLFLYK